MNAIFPLWKKNTIILSEQFIKEGFKTHICSIDTSKVSKELIGVDYSTSFLNQLPIEVDPCGENGEFHSFCYDGPIYKKEVEFIKNGIVSKTYEYDSKKYHYLFSDLS